MMRRGGAVHSPPRWMFGRKTVDWLVWVEERGGPSVVGGSFMPSPEVSKNEGW